MRYEVPLRWEKYMSEIATRKQLRTFGLIVGGSFACFGVWPLLWYGMQTHLWAIGLATLLLCCGLLWPSALRHPYRLWMAFGHILGTFQTGLFLGVIFYAIFTPISFVRRLGGHDTMQRKLQPQCDTYRLLRQPRHPSHMTHQF